MYDGNSLLVWRCWWIYPSCSGTSSPFYSETSSDLLYSLSSPANAPYTATIFLVPSRETASRLWLSSPESSNNPPLDRPAPSRNFAHQRTGTSGPSFWGTSEWWSQTRPVCRLWDLRIHYLERKMKTSLKMTDHHWTAFVIVFVTISISINLLDFRHVHVFEVITDVMYALWA